MKHFCGVTCGLRMISQVGRLCGDDPAIGWALGSVRARSWCFMELESCGMSSQSSLSSAVPLAWRLRRRATSFVCKNHYDACRVQFASEMRHDWSVGAGCRYPLVVDLSSFELGSTRALATARCPRHQVRTDASNSSTRPLTSQ